MLQPGVMFHTLLDQAALGQTHSYRTAPELMPADYIAEDVHALVCTITRRSCVQHATAVAEAGTLLLLLHCRCPRGRARRVPPTFHKCEQHANVLTPP